MHNSRQQQILFVFLIQKEKRQNKMKDCGRTDTRAGAGVGTSTWSHRGLSVICLSVFLPVSRWLCKGSSGRMQKWFCTAIHFHWAVRITSRWLLKIWILIWSYSRTRLCQLTSSSQCVLIPTSCTWWLRYYRPIVLKEQLRTVRWRPWVNTTQWTNSADSCQTQKMTKRTER